MPKTKHTKRLSQLYRYPGFRPADEVKGVFGDSLAREITLLRGSKKQRAVPVARLPEHGTTAGSDQSVIYRAPVREFFSRSKYGG